MINSFTGDYYFLSNFYMAPVSYNGWDYTNNEAAFQAQKTKNRRLKFQLFSQASPSEAKAAGRKIDLRSDWEEVKDKVMYEIVLAKFTQNPDLKEKLLATGNEHLEEGKSSCWLCSCRIQDERWNFKRYSFTGMEFDFTYSKNITVFNWY